MFGKCKVCIEKDKRLAELQAQVEFLRQFALPKQNVLPVVQLEADAVMSGREDVIFLDQEITEEQQEFDRIVSATY